MEFSQIRYFLAVCDTLNFSRAAETCSVSQPALSVAIRKLEDELGGALFIRDGRAVSLTHLGSEMRKHLGDVSATQERARIAASEIVQHQGGVLEIGASYAIGPAVMARMVAGFTAAHPGARVILHDIATSRYRELLRTGAIDFAVIGVKTPPTDRFDFLTLFEEPFVLAMADAHPLASRKVVTLPELAAANYLDRLRCDFRTDLMKQAEADGYALNVTAQSEREDWLLRLVAAGAGVTMMSKSAAAAPGVVTRMVSGVDMGRKVGLASLKEGRTSAARERFRSFVRDAFEMG